jgi:hypothetical protein
VTSGSGSGLHRVDQKQNKTQAQAQKPLSKPELRPAALGSACLFFHLLPPFPCITAGGEEFIPATSSASS